MSVSGHFLKIYVRKIATLRETGAAGRHFFLSIYPEILYLRKTGTAAAHFPP